MEKGRRSRKKNKSFRESTAYKILLCAFTVFFVLSLLLYVNEKVFHLEFLPTSAELTAFLSGRNNVVSTADGEIAVHYIDVGQGDCQLIVAGDTRVLIDSGEAIYADRVINYISQMGFRRLDYVIATHQHDDHIGGMSKILDQFTVGKIYMPQVPDELLPMGTEFESMLDVIEKRGITAEYSAVGRVLQLGNGAKLEFLAPVHDDYSTLNNYSIVCRLVHGERSFLFTGDIERAAESDLVNSGEYIRSDVIKIPHHGSTTSSTPAFIEAVSPQYAVISVGKGNSYGHPKTEILDRLSKRNCEIYTTMHSGTIVFVSDGENFTIYTDSGSGNFEEEEAA